MNLLQSFLATITLIAVAYPAMADGRASVTASRGLLLTLVPFPKPQQAPLPQLELASRAAQAIGEACVGTKFGPEVLGDLVTMRRPREVGIFEPAIARALAAAYISQSPATAERILASVRRSTNPDLAFLAALITSHVRLRAGAVPSAAELDELEALASEVSFSTADVDYFRGLMQLARGEIGKARTAVDVALKKERSFFNAHMLRIAVELRDLLYIGTSDGACIQGLTRLAASLRELTDLSPCPTQAVYIDAFLGVDQDGQHPAFLLTRIYLAAIARNEQAVRGKASTLHRSVATRHHTETCNLLMMQESNQLINLFERKHP